MKNRLDRVALGPVQEGRGDDGLRGGGEGFEEAVAARGVEFAKNVIEQEHGGLTVEGFEVARLGDFEGEGDAALLTLGSEGGGFQAVEGNFQVVAVGASDGLAKSLLLPAGGDETFGEGTIASGVVGEREGIG
jgi:hypothetical protein